ncbi:MAG: oxidoreductase [Sporolactobacillus sp.]
MTEKVWLVTGTSTGFGEKLVDELIQQNQLVVATARNPQKIAGWQTHDNVIIAPLDVTDKTQIKQAVQAAVDKWGRIDVLVNNAGWGYFGSVEESVEQDVRAMMETNFWGTSSVTRAVLPIMRAQRSGYIINITSIAGLVGTPAFGYYNATKHAVEGLMKALSQEVQPLGIHVTNIEPGPFRTDWAGRSHLAASAEIADYDQTAHAHTKTVEGFSGQQAGSPELVAKAILKLSRMAEPPLHFLAGENAFTRAQQEFSNVKKEFDQFKADSEHLYYGDEAYWD